MQAGSLRSFRLRSMSAAEGEIFVRDGLDREGDFEALNLGPRESIFLFMKQRKHQCLLADQRFGLLIDVMAELRVCFLPCFFY